MVTVSSGAFRTNTLLKNQFQLCSRGHTKKFSGSVPKTRLSISLLRKEKIEGVYVREFAG